MPTRRIALLESMFTDAGILRALAFGAGGELEHEAEVPRLGDAHEEAAWFSGHFQLAGGEPEIGLEAHGGGGVRFPSDCAISGSIDHCPRFYQPNTHGGR